GCGALQELPTELPQPHQLAGGAITVHLTLGAELLDEPLDQARIGTLDSPLAQVSQQEPAGWVHPSRSQELQVSIGRGLGSGLAGEDDGPAHQRATDQDSKREKLSHVSHDIPSRSQASTGEGTHEPLASRGEQRRYARLRIAAGDVDRRLAVDVDIDLAAHAE